MVTMILSKMVNLFLYHHLTHDEEQGIYLKGGRNLKSERVYITCIFVLDTLAWK